MHGYPDSENYQYYILPVRFFALSTVSSISHGGKMWWGVLVTGWGLFFKAGVQK